VGGAFNRRIKNAFDRAGITFAHPVTQVQIVRKENR
jgi:small-conductance mechanosensitive channel